MALSFVNRIAEQAELDAARRKGGLLVVFGRRRIGKTRMLRHWLDKVGGIYSQAIEGPPEMQIAQLFADIRSQLGTQMTPRTWVEALEVLSLQKTPWVLCLDEFPYLTAKDPSLPSLMQRFMDHSIPEGCLLILAGSSTMMMNDLFLNRGAPLYGRARKLLHVEPMDYAAFCKACGLKASAAESFEKYSCVGGVPKYWEFMEPGMSTTKLAEALYFDFSPYMEEEPHRILRDEGLTGITPMAILEAIGRGAERPSEIGTRLGTAQTNLSRALQQLLDASIIQRDMPYGESVRTTKKVLYRIIDPAMRFWFRVYSPHQSRWHRLDEAQRNELIHVHASSVFEDACRAMYPGAGRYWESNLEIDLIAPDPEVPGGVIVGEVKWRKLTAANQRSVLSDLQAKWSRCALSKKHPVARFEVFDASLISRWS
jgi:AAA+ ATPase superfamily predicted ATPase